MAENMNGTRLASSQLLQAAVQQQLQQLQRSQGARPGGQQGQAQPQLQQPKRAQNYQFTMTLQEILRKYARYPPSITFHIYETHYRFNNTQDSNIIPKESPMVKSFMKHLITEEIPAELMELLRDLAIKFYDGCLIVQVYDHRIKKGESGASNSDESKQSLENGEKQNAEVKKEASSGPDTAKSANDPKDTPKDSKTPPEPAAKPRKYRALLRPTPQSLYYDLLYHTDSALTRFTDLFALQMESELLTLTNRNLDLSVPLNPYLQHEHLKPEHEFPKVVFDKHKKEEKVLHLHREETPREIRKLHEEQMTMHKSSEYDELMLLLSTKYSSSLDTTSDKRLVVVGPTHSMSTDPTSLENTPLNTMAYGLPAEFKRPEGNNSAPVIPSSNITSNQFMRLRFIEEIRKRKESQKAQTGAAVAAQTQNTFPSNQARPGAAGVSGTGAVDANGAAVGTAMNSGAAAAAVRRPQLQTPLLGHRDGTPVGAMSSQRMLTQQPQMPRIPGNVPQQGPSQVSHAQTYNNMGNQQGSLPNRQGMPQQAQRAQNVSRGAPMQQQNMQQAVPSATSPNYIGLPVGGNARLQGGIQRPMSQMQGQKAMPGAQMARAQNAQMAKAGNMQQRNNMQERYLQQLQPDYDQAAQVQAAKRQKMQAAVAASGGAGGVPMQQNQFNLVGGRSQQMGNSSGLIGTSMQNGNMQNGNMQSGNMQSGGRMNNTGTLSSPQMSQVTPNQGGIKNTANAGQQQGQRPNTQPSGRTGPPYATQLQQQQIFQMTLSPQEQQAFRQMQAKVSALVQMGNSGFHPNRTRLTPEQQQRALQQGKALQQQMIQKFSSYFQKLRQFQILQQQRQQQMQRQQLQMQHQSQMSDGSMYSLQNSGMNLNLPGLTDQVISLPMMSQMNNGMQQGPGN